MACGAATLGTNCQPSIDAVYPFLNGDGHTHLNSKNLGFILVQVKNDPILHIPINEIFDKMDPFKCSLVKKAEFKDKIFPIPIICLLFMLSSDTPCVILHQRLYQKKRKSTNVSNFTSYNYVYKGIMPTVLKPVGESPDTWISFLNRPDQWSSFYDVPEPEVLRSQLPGCSTKEGHWKNWVEEKFMS
jgi:hypothetical protein